jgi:hypothetical protein
MADDDPGRLAGSVRRDAGSCAVDGFLDLFSRFND